MPKKKLRDCTYREVDAYCSAFLKKHKTCDDCPLNIYTHFNYGEVKICSLGPTAFVGCGIYLDIEIDIPEEEGI